MFTRIGAAAFKKDLTNTLALCQALNNPEKQFTSIHVAGTNGKGSTSHMLASILQHAGYKVGLYTSPHLTDFRERIRTNGQMIGEDEVMEFVQTYKAVFEKIEPSFFEWTVALCFKAFAKQKVDIAVIETGLGGRLDSTNIINPILSVITNIGWDHMDMLGNTLPKIAFEKAGIIKPTIPTVIGEYHQETFPVFHSKAVEQQTQLLLAWNEIEITDFTSALTHSNFTAYHKKKLWLKNVVCDLAGNYQQQNIATVLTSIIALRNIGLSIMDNDIKQGLSLVKETTGLAGRWQILAQKPLTICDTGHNKDGIKIVMNQLQQLHCNHLHMVLGMVKDKEISGIIDLLPQNATYYFCAAKLPRALPANELMLQANGKGLKGKAYNSVAEAYAQAKIEANEDDVIFIGGSTFIVAEIV
jgi:dihydrofolate synthase / folylpolyglutamate synthase